jgi:hypothetical protein
MTPEQRAAAGGSAYPTSGYTDGMTLRDYFAAHALAGYLAAHAADGQAFPMDLDAARHCYGYADAMLRERQRVRPTVAPADPA